MPPVSAIIDIMVFLILEGMMQFRTEWPWFPDSGPVVEMQWQVCALYEGDWLLYDSFETLDKAKEYAADLEAVGAITRIDKC